jgi:hypothetical protein
LSAALRQHDLRAFRPLEVGERLLGPLIGDRKAEVMAPEFYAGAISLTSNSGTSFAQPVFGGAPDPFIIS